MKRNLLITSATFLCLLALFGMNNAAYATVLEPPDMATSLPTPEDVVLTETFDGPGTLEFLEYEYHWILRITITPQSMPIHNVEVLETLSAELKVNNILFIEPPPLALPPLPPPPLPPFPPLSTIDVSPMGSSPQSAKLITWKINFIGPGDTAILELDISTDLNGAGKQSYTSCGCYDLNSGIRLDYEEQGTNGKYSEFGWVWRVCIPCDSVPLFSDILWVLPIATITGAVIVHRKRDHRT